MAVDPETGFLTPTTNYALTGFTAGQKSQILDLLRQKLNVGAACKAVGVSSGHFHLVVSQDKAFRKAYEQVKQDHLDDIVGGVYDRAKTPNGTLAAIFLLKTQRNAEYGDKTTIVHQSKPSESVFESIVDVTDSSTVAQPVAHPTGALPLGQGKATP